MPLAARRAKVAGAASFQVGNEVRVERTANQHWIHDLNMDRIKLSPGGKQWTPQAFTPHWQGVSRAVEGDTPTLDTPALAALNDVRRGVRVQACSAEHARPRRRVERLWRVSATERGKENSDEHHAWERYHPGRPGGSWATEVTAWISPLPCVHSAATPHVYHARLATLDRVSKIDRRPALFLVAGGQYVLIHALSSGDATCAMTRQPVTPTWGRRSTSIAWRSKPTPTPDRIRTAGVGPPARHNVKAARSTCRTWRHGFGTRLGG